MPERRANSSKSGGTGGTDKATTVKLVGTPFGTVPPYGNNPAVGFDKAFDDNTDTYVDTELATGGYTGIDLGLGAAARVTLIRYLPRQGEPWKQVRMVGGKFQCSSTSQTAGYVDLYVIPTTPPQAWTDVPITSSPSCRYIRYVSPAWGRTNVSEIEFWGPG